MIDRPALVAWRSKAPWPNVVQIEQDLLLSQLMIEIARDETLGPELVMRGGTCLHKLHLPTPLRYSEDLDYVRSTRGGIKPYTQALAKLASASFRRDLDALTTHIPAEYDPDIAADLVMRELGSRLRNSPPAEEIVPLGS